MIPKSASLKKRGFLQSTPHIKHINQLTIEINPGKESRKVFFSQRKPEGSKKKICQRLHSVPFQLSRNKEKTEQIE